MTNPADPARATLIVSPMASQIRDQASRAKLIDRITAALVARGHSDVVVIEASTPPTVRQAAADAVTAGSSVIAIAGGDGTVRDAAAVLAGSGITVGLIPVGTGNVYAASIGVPRDVSAAVATLTSGSPRAFDVGEVSLGAPEAAETAQSARSSPFIVSCGTGLDARLIAATSREMKRQFGVAAYFIAATRQLEHLRALPTVITIDGVRTELESVVVLVANCGEAIPGRWRPRLPIEPDDGLLHVFILPRGGVISGIRGALELMTLEAAGMSPSGSAMRLAGRHVEVQVTPAPPTQIDGDPFPPGTIDARIRPGALSILVRSPLSALSTLI